MNVAIYARVSTEEQAQEGYSIDGQIETLKSHYEKIGATIVRIYKDEGYSGKSIDTRPELKRLLQESKNNIFDTVAVWKISRLSRKQLHFLQILELLENHNIRFFSYSENIDASTAMGKAMLQMMSSFAELERNQIIDNVKMGMRQRAKQGYWNGGSVLGYSSLNKTLIINESEAEIVKHIFSLYINGKGYKAIANKLNHEGYKTKKGRAFAIPTVKIIITNPLYAGYIRLFQEQGRNNTEREAEDFTLVKGNHEPIIDEDTWQKAQTILKQKSHKPTKTFSGHFPLTTLLRCPMCGHGMIGHRVKKSKSNREYIRYYQCGNFRSKGSAVCKSNLVKANDVEEIVFQKLQRLATNTQLLKSIVERINTKFSALKDPIINQLRYTEEQLSNVEKNIKKYFNLFEESSMSSNLVKDKLISLEKELKTLNVRKKELEQELSKPTLKEVSFEHVQWVLQRFNQVVPIIEPEKLKDLLHSIINEITINKGETPDERSIKEIQLYFDASPKDNFVLTYGTVLRNVSK